jgi:hypothetical protein
MDWFEAGSRVVAGERDGGLYPALGDRDAQRLWLGGFGGAWAELPQSSAHAGEMMGASPVEDCVEAALLQALRGREELQLELWSLGLGRASRVLH